jgi:hypothetical protein
MSFVNGEEEFDLNLVESAKSSLIFELVGKNRPPPHFLVILFFVYAARWPVFDLYARLFADLLVFFAVLVVRIRMFLGLSDPDPLVRGTDPYPTPDPSLFS